MLSCAEFLAEFEDYLEEAASPEVRARLEEHLHECKTCQVIVDSTRKTIRFVTDCDSFTLTTDQVEPFVKDVMDRIRQKKPQRTRSLSHRICPSVVRQESPSPVLTIPNPVVQTVRRSPRNFLYL